MKLLNTVLFLFVLALAGLAFTACDSDDGGNNGGDAEYGEDVTTTADADHEVMIDADQPDTPDGDPDIELDSGDDPDIENDSDAGEEPDTGDNPLDNFTWIPGTWHCDSKNGAVCLLNELELVDVWLDGNYDNTNGAGVVGFVPCNPYYPEEHPPATSFVKLVNGEFQFTCSNGSGSITGTGLFDAVNEKLTFTVTFEDFETTWAYSRQ